MKIGLSSKSDRLMDLSMMAYWKIRARLLRVPGVANVAIWGERLQDMDVNVQAEPVKARRRCRSTRSWRSPSHALDAGLLQFSDRGR